MSQLKAYIIMFLFGGFLYCGTELLYRGRSHISMFLVGGFCFLLVGAIKNMLGHSASLIGQMFCCGIMFTLIEFTAGYILNHYLRMAIWDYSDQQYNLVGQICLLYSNFWMLIAAPVILLHDFAKHLLLGSPMEKYKIF